MFTISQIKKAVANDDLHEAVRMATEFLSDHSDESEAFFLRGKALWRLGEKPSAIADFETAVQLDPTSPAAAALALSKDIMNFYNPDLLNP